MGLTCNQKLAETSLIYRTELNKTRNAEKTASSHSPLCQFGRKREDLWWEGFVKEVGFELGLKEWRSYVSWEWWIYGNNWNGMCRKIRVQDGETWVKQRVDSRDEVRRSEKTDQLFVKMTMKADGKEWPQMSGYCGQAGWWWGDADKKVGLWSGLYT